MPRWDFVCRICDRQVEAEYQTHAASIEQPPQCCHRAMLRVTSAAAFKIMGYAASNNYTTKGSR